MSRGAWNLTKQSKRFYVQTYRRAGTSLVVSLLINLLLGLGIYYTYFHLPEPDFYSTDGITPPVQLTPMDEPNRSSVPLLASDQESDYGNKVIPE
ncbi:Dot/Icm secretion system protein ImcM [Legionella adelaidensis]|uniref:Dot/Icm secretion system protein ImcM n=1 Tax=Legionella adelaidensis TaxID=45056 RepID=A0A0W0R693_9GAMM|nr:type IVB secretion system protein IcmM/DotJ [Legionella adelaidensis]KTC66537.1 Dot/Icm secretion system protein ImcM [Legionella adelaidensis]